MNFISPELEKYVEDHTTAESEILSQLNRETNIKVLQPRMISGHLQGRVLSMISKLKMPQHILEIGTYTGYATLCLAEGLVNNGTIDTIDKNEELAEMQRRYFDKTEFSSQIIQHLGNALDIIPSIDKKFDLVFIDADKENYINYYNMIIDKCNAGALIICDNVLWSGKVLEPLSEKDASTKILIELNELLVMDNRVEVVLLPIRDGLSLARVK